MTPSEKFNKPVIGIIKTKELTLTCSDGKSHKLPSTEFEVIAITDLFYVCNEWHKSDVPQIVSINMVDSFCEL